MNPTIYKQADARWGSKPYPNRKSTMAGCGCGCCACTHILLEHEKYKKFTPESIRPWMVKQGYAIANQGTLHSGISATLAHYGIKSEELDTMNQLFSKMEKAKDKRGILLFKTGSRGGITWTSGGHYIAFTNYKEKDNKHYFYTKDSGGRDNDGWFCYEDHMKGLVSKIWRAWSELEDYKVAEKKYYTDQYPSAQISRSEGTKTNIKYWQKFLNWWGGYKLVVDGTYGPATKEATKDFQKKYKLVADGICGKATIKKAKKVGSSEKH